MKFPIVEVTWEDASGNDGGWGNVERAQEWKPYIIKSVGHMIRNDKKVVILVLSIYDYETGIDVNHRMNIPKNCVTDIKILRKGKK